MCNLVLSISDVSAIEVSLQSLPSLCSQIAIDEAKVETGFPHVLRSKWFILDRSCLFHSLTHFADFLLYIFLDSFFLSSSIQTSTLLLLLVQYHTFPSTPSHWRTRLYHVLLLLGPPQYALWSAAIRVLNVMKQHKLFVVLSGFHCPHFPFQENAFVWGASWHFKDLRQDFLLHFSQFFDLSFGKLRYHLYIIQNASGSFQYLCHIFVHPHTQAFVFVHPTNWSHFHMTDLA